MEIKSNINNDDDNNKTERSISGCWKHGQGRCTEMTPLNDFFLAEDVQHDNWLR